MFIYLYHSCPRMFYDVKIVVEGRTNITNMLRAKRFIYVENKLTLQHFISNEFSRNAVCNYYLTLPAATVNYAMIFPVRDKSKLMAAHHY